MEEAKIKYSISDQTKNIVCGISASGPTKRWDIQNYIKLFENLDSKFKCKINKRQILPISPKRG